MALATISFGHGRAETFYHGDLLAPSASFPANTLMFQLSAATTVPHGDFSPIHAQSLPQARAYTKIDVPRFYLTQSLNSGINYSSFSTTPLPCAIPSGAMLYLVFGAFKQQITTASDAAAGATTVAVTTFTSHHNFSATTYFEGEITSSGAEVTIGLNADLSPNQPILFSAGDAVTSCLVAHYTPKDATSIPVTQLVSNYPFDGQDTTLTFAADATAGSNQLLNASPLTGIHIGQAIQSSFIPWDTPLIITDVDSVANTITVERDLLVTEVAATFTIEATQLVAPYEMTLGSGGTQEFVYPISLPVQDGEYYSINLGAATSFDHIGGESLTYYQWPQNPQFGDTTYREDLDAFYLWDNEHWRTARVNHIHGVYSILGAVGGNDFTSITVQDPETGQETPPDTFTNVSSKGHEVHLGGSRHSDPNKEEWTGKKLRHAKLHLKVRIPQSSKVAFRSIGIQAAYKSASLPKFIHLSPADSLEIAPGITNSVNWVFDDLDGDTQAGWEVRIFDGLTYNSSAFDPSTSTPLWKTSGHDATTSVNIPATVGFRNGDQYWAFVRVAKQFHQTRWFGKWGGAGFTVVVDRPSAPLVSIHANAAQAANTINIQATDNLLGPNNGGFEDGLGGWVANSATSGATIDPLVTGIALTNALKLHKPITSLAVGAVGYIARGSSISATGLGTFKVSGSRKKNTDPLGFPRAGRFWVRIGSENILVTNKMDGNNSGDTFKIIARNYTVQQPGPLSTQSSHATGATVTFGLQNPIHTGSTVDMEFSYTQTVHSTKKVTSMVRYYTGTYGSPGSAGTTSISPNHLLICGAYGRSDVEVKDVNAILSSSSVGKNVTITFNHWDKVIAVNYKIVTDKHGNQTQKAVTSTEGGVKSESNTISGIKILNTFYQPGLPTDVLAGTVTATRIGSKSNPITELVIHPNIMGFTGVGITGWSANANQNVADAPKIPHFISAGATISLRATVTIPATTRLVGYRGHGTTTITVPAKTNVVSITATLSKEWHEEDTVMHIHPIWNIPNLHGGSGGFGNLNGYLQINAGTQIWRTVEPQRICNLVQVNLAQPIGHSAHFKNQRATFGDTLNLDCAMTSAPIPAVAGTPGVYKTRPVTTTQEVTTKQYHDAKQTAIVGFNPNGGYAEKTGTIGFYDGSSTFTAYTSASTDATFNAVALNTNPGSVVGLPVSCVGIPNGAIVAAVHLLSGQYVITFKNPADTTSAVLNGKTAFTSLSGSGTPQNPITSVPITFTTSTMVTIPAGSTSIPIKPFIPKIGYPAHTPVNIRYHTPAFFGRNSFVVHANSTKTISVALPAAKSAADWNGSNSVKVRSGTTYGLAAFTKVVSGGGSPQFSLYMDWFTEGGQYLATSNGEASPTVSNTRSSVVELGSVGQEIVGSGPNLPSPSITTGVRLNSTDNVYGADWTPNAIVVVAPPGATRGVPRIEWSSPSVGDTYALSSVMVKALSIPNAGPSSVLTTTEIPSLIADVNPDALGDATAIVIDPNTQTEGSASLYYFDPYNQHGTRELVLGLPLNQDTMWTQTMAAVAVGDRTIPLRFPTGLGVGSAFTIDYGTSNAETVTVKSISDNVITITGTFAKAHALGANVYAKVVRLAHHTVNTHAAGEPVAVFNWNRDGYLNSNHGSYYFKVEKSEDGGKTWTTLRSGAQVPVSGSGFASITDYEVIPNLTTLYRVSPSFTTTISGDQHTTKGASTGNLTAPVLNTKTWWISSTSDETKRFPILVKDGFQETQKHPSGVFYPLGSKRPYTVGGVVQGRDGSITVIWTDLANWDNFIALLEKGETLILTNPVEPKRIYIFINGDVQITHNAAASPWREVAIQYVEAAPPDFGYTYGS